MKIKLAEALLRRKELNEKVSQLKDIKDKDTFEVVARRQQVSEGIDDVVAQIPKLDVGQVTAEYDHYARALRLIDGSIQQTNWSTSVEVGEETMKPWAKPE
jgi:hypothetical protein